MAGAKDMSSAISGGNAQGLQHLASYWMLQYHQEDRTSSPRQELFRTGCVEKHIPWTLKLRWIVLVPWIAMPWAQLPQSSLQVFVLLSCSNIKLLAQDKNHSFSCQSFLLKLSSLNGSISGQMTSNGGGGKIIALWVAINSIESGFSLLETPLKK